MSGVRGYIFSRPFLGERVPQHVQNIVIRDYCARKKLTYLLSATEYAMSDCYIMLEQTLSDIRNLDGIVCYSLFQLPTNRCHRKAIYERILDNGRQLHFSVESLSILELRDIQRVDDIWEVRTVLPKALSATELTEKYSSSDSI